MPASGPWGTEVTIDGANFGPVVGSTTVAFMGLGANGFVVDTWHDTEIRGRVAFPASGMMFVGPTAAGTFTTDESYKPSMAFDVAELVEPFVLSTNQLAGLYREYELSNEAALAVFDGSNAGAYALDGLVDPADPMSPLVAHVSEADDHSPVVIATKHDGTIVLFGVQGAALTTTPTGLTGRVLAAARDTTGLYAGIATTAGVVRARPGSPWTTDRGPFTSADAPLDGAVAAAGTLWVAVSEPATGAAYVSLETLSPTDTSFSALERADSASHATTITTAHIMLGADGVHALVSATADGGDKPMRLRTAAATWSAAPTVPGLAQYAFIGSTLAAIVNDPTAKTTSLVPDATMPSGATVIPVWPMQSEGMAIDAAGKAHALITNSSVTYGLTPP